MSLMAMSCRLPTQFGQWGSNAGALPLSHRLQSLPGVPGQGTHGPSMFLASPLRHLCGVVSVSLGPGMQRGPSQVDGIGMRDHIEPTGVTPSVTNIPCGVETRRFGAERQEYSLWGKDKEVWGGKGKNIPCGAETRRCGAGRQEHSLWGRDKEV